MKYNIQPELLIIDSFCGAGGVTEGFEKAMIGGNKVAMVIVGINHDTLAIESHKANHPETLHFTEDMRTLDLFHQAKGESAIERLNKMKARFPEAKILFHASLECTNFSRAKGGLPRDADSRTLAEHLYRYVEALNPDYITIENVVEFMSWGKLNENGKPVSRDNGAAFNRWKNKIKKYGYYDKWTQMNSANYGAYTSRNRLFGCFAKDDLPIVFPEPTHSKNPDKHSLFASLEKWKPVREVLELEDKGKSIFEREKPLSEKTLSRIYAGLIKFIAGGKDAFLLKWNSTSKQGVHHPPSVDEPCPVVSTQNRLGVVQPQFISKYFSGHDASKNVSLDNPGPTVKPIDNTSLISTEFIQAYHGNGDNVHSVDGPAPVVPTHDSQAVVQPEFFVNYHHSSSADSLDKPCPTLTCKDKLSVCQPQFIYREFKTATNQSINDPAGTITTTPKMNIISAEQFIANTNFNNIGQSVEQPLSVITANRKHHYIINPMWGDGSIVSIENPSPTIIARQDKAPLYLVATEDGRAAIIIYETDSEFTKKIKEFMALYGIIDIKMRMLKVKELMKIQGFPDGYILKGSQAHQKKFIGNSVVPLVMQKWAECLVLKLRNVQGKHEAA